MGKLQAGTGKACIDVPEELYPFPIYENYFFEAMGDSGSLYARALLIDNGTDRFLFVSTDVADAPGESVRRHISEKYEIPLDHMYVTATHNHSAPHGGGRLGGGPNPDPLKTEKELAYRSVYEAGILDAVGQAVSSLRPACYGYGEGTSQVNVNRDQLLEDGYWTQGQNFTGPSDKTLAAMKFVDEEGRLIGAVVNYACHGTCAFCSPDTDGLVKVTPGFMGIASSYAEQRFGNDAVILWTNGCSGDQNPVFSSEGFPLKFDPDGTVEPVRTPGGTQYLIQKHLGCTHGVDIIRTLNKIHASHDEMSITTTQTVVELEGQQKPEGADMGLNKAFIDNTVRLFRPELCVDGKVPAKHLVEMEPSDEPVHMKMWLAMLGDTAWIGVAGEPYCTIGMKCKAASSARHTVMVLHVDDEASAGYILDDASADHKVFQSYGRVHPGHVDDAIVAGVKRMCEQVTDPKKRRPGYIPPVKPELINAITRKALDVPYCDQSSSG